MLMLLKNDENNRRMIFTALHETFITYLKVAFFASIFITSPIILNPNLEIYCSWLV